MVIQFIPHCFEESVLDTKSEITSSELFVTDGPDSRHSTSPFKVKILRYAKHLREIHDLEKYLHLPLMKGESGMAANWSVCNK